MDYNDILNIAVFTTSFVVKKKSPIVYISHDDDGAWQFFSSENVPISEAMLVSLGEIIEIDSTVKDVLEMPLNHYALRKDRNSSWVILPKN